MQGPAGARALLRVHPDPRGHLRVTHSPWPGLYCSDPRLSAWAPSAGVEVDVRGGPTTPLLSIPEHPRPGAALARRHGGQHTGRYPRCSEDRCCFSLLRARQWLEWVAGGAAWLGCHHTLFCPGARPPGQGSSREWPSIPWLMTKGSVALGRPCRLQAGPRGQGGQRWAPSLGPPRDILTRMGQSPALPPSPFAHTNCPPGPGVWAPDHF